MKIKIITILIMTLLLTSCSSKHNITTINIDDKLSYIERITYDTDLLKEEYQESLRDSQVTNENLIINYELINSLQYPSNALPDEFLFSYNINLINNTPFQHWGLWWELYAWENNSLETTGVMITKLYNHGESLEQAKLEIRTAGDNFAKTYGNIIYTSNIYSQNLDTLGDAVVSMISDTGEYIIVFETGLIEQETPYMEITFLKRKALHLIDEYSYRQKIATTEERIRVTNKMFSFNTLRNHPQSGFIISGQKAEENLSEEEKFMFGIGFELPDNLFVKE